jgi:coenzyme F420-dependent glucose-6-phosphate dehydrogenase
MRIGFHASHEQFTPSRLLGLAVRAERAGFAAAMCSDHFAPFSERQGQSGFAWSWLGAALQATALSFGTVSAPGYRYHPAVLAQGMATLAELFPERCWFALGSGELINERVTGAAWPPMDERRARLHRSALYIKALLRGEVVSSLQEPVLRDARLYTLPPRPPEIFGAAVSPESAALVARWADGLITVNQAPERLAEVVRAFRENGGAGKPMFLQVHVGWAPTEAEALAQAHDQWRTNVLVGPGLWDAPGPEHLDAAAAGVRPEDLRGPVRISADLARHREWLEADRALGFDTVYLHEVGSEQERFIDVFGEKVLTSFE